MKASVKKGYKTNLVGVLLLVLFVGLSALYYKNQVNSLCHTKALMPTRVYYDMIFVYGEERDKDLIAEEKEMICRKNPLPYIFDRNISLYEEELNLVSKLYDSDNYPEETEDNLKQTEGEPIQKKDYSDYLNKKILLSTPGNWDFYNKIFAKNRFIFRYPSNRMISDEDPDSGSIEVRLSPNSSDVVTIEPSPYTYSQYVYKGGDLLKWIQDWHSEWKGVKNVDYSKMEYEEINFSNGKKYFRITKWADGTIDEEDYFLGIQNGIPVELTDNSSLTQVEILTILQSLTIQ